MQQKLIFICYYFDHISPIEIATKYLGGEARQRQLVN